MGWYRNLRIRAQLRTSFYMVAFFAVLLSALAVLSINRLDGSYTYLLDYPQKRLEYLMQIEKGCSDMRRTTTAISLNINDSGVVNNYWAQFEQSYDSTLGAANNFLANNSADTIRDSATVSTNNEAMLGLKKQLESYKEQASKAVTAARSGDFASTNAAFLAAAPIVAEVVATTEDLIIIATSYTAEVSVLNTQEKNSAIILILALLAVIIVMCLIIVYFVSGIIAKPLSFLAQALEQFGFRGDTELPPDVAKSAEECVKLKGEIGICARAFGAMLEYIHNVGHALERVSDGDLTVDMKVLSEKDSMGIALNKMIVNLNTMFGDIRTASGEVSSGAGQVSRAAQSLASASSQQAASIEEFTASINDLREKTNLNAENSVKAQEANNKAGDRLEDSIRSMGEMLDAMKAIDESSASITKVIKVIDDIAFQTNILALNAAVEAARAGQHGKGFAVVAEEVRNLASKSAQAAKETAALIEGSTGRVKEGNQIVAKTNADLEAAVENSRESTRLIEQVAKGSAEQASAIAEINMGIEQISTVVQANSATAEQSSAAAEQMSAQANRFNEIVTNFRLNETISGTKQARLHSEESDIALIGGKY